LADESDYTYKDCAILARANRHLDPFIFALRKYGLPYQLVGNRGLYDREEIRDVMALLKFVVDPTDGLSAYRVLNIDSLNIPGEEISGILSGARKRRVSMWELIKVHEDKEIVQLNTKLKEFQDHITKLTPSEFVYRVVNAINYLAPLLKEETIENQMSIKNLDLFLNKAKQFEVNFQGDTKEMPTIVDFVDYVDLLIDAGDNPAQAELQDVDTINLMTVHASKGLEFPAVFMVNLIGGRFPTRNRKDRIDLPDELIKETLPVGDAHIQEERRLFYVGMTRAQKYLYMTYANNYGGKRDTKESGYLGELGLKTKELTGDDVKGSGDQIGLFGLESGFREPKAEKIKDFSPRFLSYTQVNTFKTCALKYKYSYVLNIPQPPNHALSFGSTIHDTLKDFHTAEMIEEVSLGKLLEMYEKNWQPAGYMSAEHRETRFGEGKELLKRYHKDNKKEKVKPLAIEKSFNVWIGGTKFFGRIDRIDELSGGGVEVVDYKTGQAKDQKFVDKDDQVTFYAIGVKEALGFNPKKLTLHFVGTGEKISTTRTEEHFKEAKKEVTGIIKDIKSGEFKASPGRHCDWCSYRDVCPYAFRG
jgi:DNA helicase-2/ATP-dependent DNA helicase PcrA